jgi:hypothetical protein
MASWATHVRTVTGHTPWDLISRLDTVEGRAKVLVLIQRTCSFGTFATFYGITKQNVSPWLRSKRADDSRVRGAVESFLVHGLRKVEPTPALPPRSESAARMRLEREMADKEAREEKALALRQNIDALTRALEESPPLIVVLVDKDNCIDAPLDDATRLTMPAGMPPLLSFRVFFRKGTTYSHEQVVADVAPFSTTLCPTLTTSKDAADVRLSVDATLLHMRLPRRVCFVVVSGDGFAEELVEGIRSQGRRCHRINNNLEHPSVSLCRVVKSVLKDRALTREWQIPDGLAADALQDVRILLRRHPFLELARRLAKAERLPTEVLEGAIVGTPYSVKRLRYELATHRGVEIELPATASSATRSDVPSSVSEAALRVALHTRRLVDRLGRTITLNEAGTSLRADGISIEGSGYGSLYALLSDPEIQMSVGMRVRRESSDRVVVCCA